jgi:hypothetical protein
VTTDQRVVAKQEIQKVESVKRAGAPYAHHRNQAVRTIKPRLPNVFGVTFRDPISRHCIFKKQRGLPAASGNWNVKKTERQKKSDGK